MRLGLFVLLIAVVVVASVPAGAAQVNWVGLVAGYWQDAYNWSSNPYLPGPNDDVRIFINGLGVVEHNTSSHTVRSLTCDDIFNLSGGALTLNYASSCPTAFYLTGGSLYGTGSLSIGGSSIWTAGNFAITGGVTNNGVLDISGTGWKPLRTTLNNAKTVTQKTSIDISANGVLNNYLGGVYNLDSDAGITNNASGGNIYNNGTFQKINTTGISDILPWFANNKQVYVDHGTLKLSGGDSVNGGIYDVVNGSILHLAGSDHSVYGSCVIRGTGSVQLTNGTMLMNDSSVLDCHLYGGFNILGATISGRGKLKNTDRMEWHYGSLVNAGDLDNQSLLLLMDTNQKTMQGSIIGNSGTIKHSGAGSLSLSASSHIHNLRGGTYNFQSDADLLSSDGTSVFHNNGTLSKTYGGGTSTVQLYMDNRGYIDLDSGNLQLTGGGQFVDCGAEMAWPARLSLDSGTYTMYGTFEAGGTGFAMLNAGTVSLTYGATIRFGLEGGLQLAGSAVSGYGNLINTWNADWSAGAISGDCHFTNEGTLTMSGSGEKHLQQSQFANMKDIVQTGTGNVRLSAVSTMANVTNSSYEFRSDAGIVGSGTINNSGVFRKKWSYGTSTIEPRIVNNGGWFDLQDGSIKLTGGGDYYDGYANILFQNSLSMSSGVYNMNGIFQASGDGALVLNGGTLNMAAGSQTKAGLLELGLKLQGSVLKGPGALINTGKWEWTSGALTESARITNNGTMTLAGTGTKQLSNASYYNPGTISHTGLGPLEFRQGATLDNGGTYEFAVDAHITSLDSGNAINNGGFFVKDRSTGTTRIQPAFNNRGTINVKAGVLTLEGGGSFYESYADILDNTRLEFASGTFDLTGNFTVTGYGLSVLSTDFVLNYGAHATFASTQGFRMTRGTISGQGGVFCPSNSEWTGGSVAEGAVLINQGTMTLSGNLNKYLKQANLSAESTLYHTGLGNLDVSEGSRVNVSSRGSYIIQSDCDITGLGEVYTGGVFKKIGGLGESVVEPALNSNGLVEVASGSLIFRGPVRQIVDGALTGGQWVVHPRCALSLGSDTRIVRNDAEITLTGECEFPQLDGMAANNGVLRLREGRWFNAGEVFTNTGELEQDGGEFRSKKLLNTGLWYGSGVIASGFTNRGQLQLRHYWGDFRINGGFSQNEAGKLQIILDGTKAGQFGCLNVGGNATLGGTLELQPSSFYIPKRGDSFKILNCRLRTGKFATITGADLGNGLWLNPIYTTTGVTLVVGDYLPATTDLASVAAVRNGELGAWVSCPGVVSAVFAGSFFVQDSNRAAGIRVVSSQAAPQVGQSVVVAGKLQPYAPCVTLETAVWCEGQSTTLTPPRPLYIGQKSLGGASIGLQGGVYGGVGLNNVGLLVRISGRITYLEATGKFAYIDDGTGLSDGNKLILRIFPARGVKVILPAGTVIPTGAKYLSVTGVSYREYMLDRPQREVLVRGVEDVRS